jgi:hypothetical protein
MQALRRPMNCLDVHIKKPPSPNAPKPALTLNTPTVDPGSKQPNNEKDDARHRRNPGKGGHVPLFPDQEEDPEDRFICYLPGTWFGWPPGK